MNFPRLFLNVTISLKSESLIGNSPLGLKKKEVSYTDSMKTAKFFTCELWLIGQEFM